MLAREGKEAVGGGLQGQHKGSGGSRALSSSVQPQGTSGWVDGWVGDHRVLLPSGPNWF